MVKQSSKFDVLCSCGHGFCFLCLSEPHWPCDCEQARKYLEELPTLKPTNDHDLDPESVGPDVATQLEISDCQMFEMKSRICPKCSSLIDNDGIWCCMICRCRHKFCWNCMKAWKKHKEWSCVISVPYVLKFTHKTTTKHTENPKLFTLEGESKSPNTDVCQQKAAMYTKALEQRLEASSLTEKQIQEMMRKIIYCIEHNRREENEILCVCNAPYNDKTYKSVEKFLRSSVESIRAILHLAEFTFVLLKDMAASEEKSRALSLLQDLLGYCSLMKYVLESLDPHPVLGVRTPIRLLVDTQKWSKRSTADLVSSIGKLKGINERYPNHPPT